MNHSLPHTPQEYCSVTWAQLEPMGLELLHQPVNASNLESWLLNWSDLGRAVSEAYQRRWVATVVDTSDQAALRQYQAFLDEIQPAWMAMEHKLKEKLLASGLEPSELKIPLRNMRAEIELFHEANLPLLSEELKLSNAYDQIIGAQTISWEGREVTLSQLLPVYQEPDRQRRELAWKASAERHLADRLALNDLWKQLLQLRLQLASNAGKPDYRAYRWQQMLRFDYTPDDCTSFHQAIEKVVVPAASRLYKKRRKRLGLNTLRPWDLEVNLFSPEPLHPYHEAGELAGKVNSIYTRLDPKLGEYFSVMRQEGLLDLDNRKNKAPGGFCTYYEVSRRPFIFMNGVGLHDDVMTLLHEGGHAFQGFEGAHLPYQSQLQVGLEFSEVASMSMELLGAPYLDMQPLGFYTSHQAAQARLAHLEGILLFWPYMAVVDAFQHWVYTHPSAASHPDNCDTAWTGLWQRFMPGVDWAGLEDSLQTGWQRKLHIFQVPFYYVEYGMAQLGAVQVWRNALLDQSQAIADYRKALALGGTVTLSQLYQVAGAKFAFDASTLRAAVDLIESTLQTLEASLN